MSGESLQTRVIQVGPKNPLEGPQSPEASGKLMSRSQIAKNSQDVTGQGRAKTEARTQLRSEQIDENISNHFTATKTCYKATTEVMGKINSCFGFANKMELGSTILSGTKSLFDKVKQSSLLDVGSKLESATAQFSKSVEDGGKRMGKINDAFMTVAKKIESVEALKISTTVKDSGNAIKSMWQGVGSAIGEIHKATPVTGQGFFKGAWNLAQKVVGVAKEAIVGGISATIGTALTVGIGVGVGVVQGVIKGTAHLANLVITGGIGHGANLLFETGKTALSFGKAAAAAVGNVGAKAVVGVVGGTLAVAGYALDIGVKAAATTLNLGLNIAAGTLGLAVTGVVGAVQALRHPKMAHEIIHKPSETKTQMQVVDNKMAKINESLKSLGMGEMMIDDPKPPQRPTFVISKDWWKTVFSKNATIGLGVSSTVSTGKTTMSIGAMASQGASQTKWAAAANYTGSVVNPVSAAYGLYSANYSLKTVEEASQLKQNVSDFKEGAVYKALETQAKKPDATTGDKQKFAEINAMLDQLSNRTGTKFKVAGAMKDALMVTSGTAGAVGSISTLVAGAAAAGSNPVGWAATGAFALASVGLAQYKVCKVTERAQAMSKLEHQHEQVKQNIQALELDISVKGESPDGEKSKTLEALKSIENDISELRMRKDPKYATEKLTQMLQDNLDDPVAKGIAQQVMGYEGGSLKLSPQGELVVSEPPKGKDLTQNLKEIFTSAPVIRDNQVGIMPDGGNMEERTRKPSFSRATTFIGTEIHRDHQVLSLGWGNT